jgi:hypothetical protein
MLSKLHTCDIIDQTLYGIPPSFSRHAAAMLCRLLESHMGMTGRYYPDGDSPPPSYRRLDPNFNLTMARITPQTAS